MNKLLLAAAALGLLALVPTLSTPAYAVCNPGTPNCIKVSPSLAKIKAQLTNPGTLGSGDIDCQGTKLCGIDTGDGTSPGVLAVRSSPTPSPSSVPVQQVGSVQVR